MKKKLLFVLLSNISFSLYCQTINYGFLRDSFGKYNDDYYEIKKSEIIQWNNNKYDSFIYYNPYNDKFEVSIFYDLRGIYVMLNSDDLMITESERIIKNDFIQLIPCYYLDYLSNKNFNIILDNQPKWEDFKSNNLYDFGGTFKSAFRPEKIIMSNIALQFNYDNQYIFETVKKSDDIYYIKMVRRKDNKFNYDAPFPANYLKYKDNKEIILLVKFDGDYADIWINSKNEYLGKYYAVPKETTDQIHYLVAEAESEGIFNPLNIYWPRHADGSSDFDKKIIPPMVKLEKETRKQSTNVVDENKNITNVKTNKTMTVNENLKLRSGEATSTQVLTVMSAGTKVKILELGKAETIDGINSNWVKVEVQSDAKDRDGNPIKAGTVGWCYGGYLE